MDGLRRGLQIQASDQGPKAQESAQECLSCHLQSWGLAVLDPVGVRYQEYTFPFPSIPGSMADFEAT